MVLALLLNFPSLSAQLGGTYTIGGDEPDYVSIGAAVEDLNTAGVSGAVNFLLRPGVYTEQVILHAVNGASPNHTITFESASGKASDVEVYYEGQRFSREGVVQFDGAKHFRLRNLTLKGSGRSHNHVVSMVGEVRDLVVEGCRLLAPKTEERAEMYAVLYLDPSLAVDIRIRNNYVTGGSIGIYCGEGSNGKTTGTEISGNSVDEFRYAGVYLSGLRGGTITGNRLVGRVKRNTPYGLYGRDAQGSLSSPLLIANNFVSLINNGERAIFFNGSANLEFFHNSVYASDTALAVGLYGVKDVSLQNNSFASEANVVVEMREVSSVAMDYNNLFTGGLYLARYNGVVLEDLAAWQQVSGMGEHSFSMEPQFVSATDLHSDAPALAAAGISLAKVSVDIDGEARKSTPSIGADEYSTEGTSPLAGIYTIGGSGADFATLNAAVDALRKSGIDDAVVFNIAPGIYEEQVEISSIYGSSPTHTVTFQSATGQAEDVVVTYAAATPEENYVILFSNARHVRLKNLTVRAFGTVSGQVVKIMQQATDILLQGNRIAAPLAAFPSPASTGIAVSPSRADGIRIHDNHIYGGVTGIHFVGTEEAKPTGTEIIDNFIENFETNGVHITSLAGGRITGNRLVDDSTSYTRHGFNIADWSGTAASPVLAANNFISIVNGGSRGIIWSRSTNVQLFHNSVYMSDTGFGLFMGKLQNVAVKNNIFQSENSSSVLITDVDGLDMNYNDLFSRGFYLAVWNYNDVPDLDVWRSVSGQGANSVSVDPEFVSATDLHVRAPGLANAGIAVPEVTVDIDGEPRDDSPSIGADEFCTDGDGSGDACKAEGKEVSEFWLEAECGALGALWKATQDPDATNQTYVSAPGQFAYGEAPYDGPAQRIRFLLQHTAAGDYFFHVRAFTPDRGSDSFWLRVNGGQWIKWNGIDCSRKFSWATLPDTLELIAGTNTIDIAYREGGTLLDKIHLSQEAGTPGGFGEPATNCPELTNQPPVAVAAASVTQGVAPLTVQLDGSASYDYDGQIVEYSWNWSGGNASGATPTVSLMAGTHDIELTVTDNAGDANATTITVRVAAPSGIPSAIPFAFEAECTVRDRDWRLSADSEASGNRFVSFTGCRCEDTPSQHMAGQYLDYDFVTSEADIFYLFLRMDAPDVGRNSFWVRMDEGEWIKMWRAADGSALLTDGFEWRRVNDDARPVSFALAPGKHTITVAPREPGTKLDKLILSTSVEAPVGNGAPAANCSSPLAAGVRLAKQQEVLPYDEALFTEASLALFPNPATDQLTIELTDGYTGKVDVTLVDGLGRRVRQWEYDKGDRTLRTEVRVGDLPPGIYYLQVRGKCQTVERFVKR